jgi:hypothetical protein
MHTCRMEKVEMNKVRCQTAGTLVTVAGAVL